MSGDPPRLNLDALMEAVRALDGRVGEPYWTAVKPPWYRLLARFNYWRLFSRPTKKLMKEFERVR